VVVGEPGSKKTYLLVDVGVCLALGVPWLDRQTKQVTVLLIDEESGTRRLLRRLGAVMRAHSAGKDLPLAYVTMSGLSLLEPDAADKLVQLIEAAGAGFVIIDALADVMLGGDENAVKDVQRVFYNLRHAAERTGAAIVVIHHTSKAGGYRGSSAIKGAVDLMLMVESKPTSPNIDMSTLKSRDTEPFNLYAVARFEDEVTVISSSTGASPTESLSVCERHVLQYLAENGDATVAEIQANAGKHSADAARQAVYALKRKSRVERRDDGGAGARATYGVVASGDV
jgi:predicted ATP-dependent serine protease